MYKIVSHGFDLHLFITNEVEHLFIYLLAIWVSFLVTCLFIAFAHFLLPCPFPSDLQEFFINRGYQTFVNGRGCKYSPNLWLVFLFCCDVSYLMKVKKKRKI